MKKTLIALMALAGVAMADITGKEMNTWLEEALTHRGNSRYTLTFTLSDDYAFTDDGDYGTIFTINSNGWKIIHQQTKYVALATSTVGDYRPSDSYLCRFDATLNYIDMDASPVFDSGTKVPTGETVTQYAGWVYEYADSVNMNQIAGSTFTITGTTGSSIVSFTTADGTRTIELQRDGFIDPDGLAFAYSNGAAFKSASITFDSGTYTIPEPATATLSLLALAGLCARRRRA